MPSGASTRRAPRWRQMLRNARGSPSSSPTTSTLSPPISTITKSPRSLHLVDVAGADPAALEQRSRAPTRSTAGIGERRAGQLGGALERQAGELDGVGGQRQRAHGGQSTPYVCATGNKISPLTKSPSIRHPDVAASRTGSPHDRSRARRHAGARRGSLVVPRAPPRPARRARRAGPPRRAAILDAGCGSGRTLDELARPRLGGRGRLQPDGGRGGAAARARERPHRAVEELPFGDRAFDLVTCLDVIEHTPDDRATLAELLRVTRRAASWSPPSRRTRRCSPRTTSSTATTAATAPRRCGRRPPRRAGARSRTRTSTPCCSLPRRSCAWRAATARAARSELTFTPHLLDRALELPMAREAKLIGAGTGSPSACRC